MKRITIILFFLGSLIVSAQAQSYDSLKKIYVNQTIYRYGGHFIKGNERLDFHDLEGEFDFSDVGYGSYLQAKKFRTISKIFRYVSIASTFVIAPLIHNNSRDAAYIFLGINFALGSGAAIYSNLSNQNLDRAIYQRNKDLLFPDK
jgi:hypothetical protein